MIELHLVSVDNTLGIRYSGEKKRFRNMEEAKEYLEEEFGHNTKQKMFIDTPEKAMHCGYVFKRWSFYEDNGKQFSEHVWVTFYEVTMLDLEN